MTSKTEIHILKPPSPGIRCAQALVGIEIWFPQDLELHYFLHWFRGLRRKHRAGRQRIKSSPKYYRKPFSKIWVFQKSGSSAQRLSYPGRRHEDPL